MTETKSDRMGANHPPVFQPDPELIEHMENNRRWGRWFRDEAMKARIEVGLSPLVNDPD